MAASGYKLFVTGDVLTAAQVNDYLMLQTVMVFANSAARTTALSGVLAEGLVSYLKDTDVVEVYTGSAWVSLDDPNAIQNSIVDAKGDLITATADNTPARLAVGNNGETLVADSSATTGLRYQSNFAAGKNAIINGAFNVWQRGTTFTSPANGAYTADRFKYAKDGTGTATVSQQAFTAGTAPAAGYESQYFLRCASTAAGTSTFMQMSQPIEDVRSFAGQTVTLSFWAKSDTARSSFIYAEQNFGSGGSATVQYLSMGSASTTTSWQRFTFTVALTSISGKTVGTSSYLEFFIRLGAVASGATLDIWGVQVEAGSVATAFQTATGTLQGELAACQRYYQIVHSFTGNASTTSQIHAPLNFVMPMRTSPSVAGSAALYVSDGTNDFQQSSTSVAFVNGNRVTSQNCQLVMTNFTGMTQWRSYMQVSTAGGDIQLSAEL